MCFEIEKVSNVRVEFGSGSVEMVTVKCGEYGIWNGGCEKEKKKLR